MRQPYWKPQHEVFIRGMLAHGDKIKAYKEAYPGISPASVRQSASRLLSCPHIKQRINTALAEAKENAMKKLEQTTQTRVDEQLLAAYEQRKFLADIILGRIKLRRSVKLNNRVVEIDQDLDPYIVLRAIELDCKLEAGYEWRTNDGTIEREMDRLAHYLHSPNHQGVGVSKQIETDSRSNPPWESISFFPRPPFVTENIGK